MATDHYFFQVGPTLQGVVRPEADDAVAKLSKESVAKAIETAGDLAGLVKEKIEPLDIEGFAFEFGVNVGGEAGIPLVTKGTVEAHFTVTLEWKRK